MIPLSHPIIGDREQAAVARVLASGHLAQGPEVEQFETEFAAFTSGVGGGLHAVATSNGTTALQMALLAVGVGAGDEVVIPSFTFLATANAVRATGATPVFVDVDPRTFTIDAAAVAAALSPRTVAVIPVHLYGQPADMESLMPLVQRHGLAVIEDAAQAHGASLRGRPVGTFGLGCFSFYPTKNMTTGEGGMVTTTDAALADRMRLIRNHGMRGRYEFEMFGLNLRMTDIAAAIGRVQLKQLGGWNERRRSNAAWLDSHLGGLTIPFVQEGARHVYHQYTVLSDERDALIERLRRNGIGYGIYYSTPAHRTAPYAVELDLPVTERLAEQVLSLPVRSDLLEEELHAIADAVMA
jgi:hypothetical protein